MKQKLNFVIMTICITIIAWLFLSFLEVNAKNLDENPQYSKYNAFVLLTEGR